MATHNLPWDAAPLHGAFDRDQPPVLTIEPGDTVRYRTLDASWHALAPPANKTQRVYVPKPNPERDIGHPLVGPVAIRGAEPGMTLVVKIGQLVPGAWGFNVGGGSASPLNDRLGLGEGTREAFLRWTVDVERGRAVDQFGHTVLLDPFLGVIGVAPAETGWHSTAPPRVTGGNLDCKELVPGSTLYLPIAVPGALVSTGDGHARQGDGEVSGTAIECPMDVAELTYDLLPNQPLPTPWAETPVGTLTFGFDEDLDEAMAQALDAMLTLMGQRYGIERPEAMALASVVVDLRITQVVNGVRGAHAVLADGAVSRKP